MGDLGKKIRVFTVPQPIPMPEFMPVKKPVTVPAEEERELVPVRRKAASVTGKVVEYTPPVMPKYIITGIGDS